ncbi:MAG: 50S ribosomal protein L19 [Candidatus Omnitrophica bacterium]|nr:50S ribosomal protein L19 [Candidatus Omnitrophota bacterium]
MGKLFEVEKELKAQMEREDYPEFSQGDLIKVFYKIRERDKERIHPVQGIVLKIQGQMHRKSFTLRRIAYGEAYEVTFPYYSPKISRIELLKRTKRKPRRKRLYYLRGRVGKKAMQT